MDAYSAVLGFDSGGGRCASMGEGTVNVCVVHGGFFVNGQLLADGTSLQQQLDSHEAENAATILEADARITELESQLDSHEAENAATILAADARITELESRLSALTAVVAELSNPATFSTSPPTNTTTGTSSSTTATTAEISGAALTAVGVAAMAAACFAAATASR